MKKFQAFWLGLKDGKEQGTLNSGWTFENSALDNAYGRGANVGEWLARPGFRNPWTYHPEA